MFSPKWIMYVFAIFLIAFLSASWVGVNKNARRGTGTSREGAIARAEEDGSESEPPSPWLNGNKRDDPSRMLDRFSQLDSNHDGYITFDEWNGSQTSFNQMDNNGDGRISRGEFLGIEGGRE